MKTFLLNYLSEILHTEEIDETANLLSYGLNSIHLMKLIGLLKTQNIEVTFLDLIKTPTLQSWTVLCENKQIKETYVGSASCLSPARFPLTNMQRAYLLGRDSSVPLGGISCHAYVEFEPKVEIDLNRLNTSFHKLLLRHKALRSKFYPDGTQEIMPAESISSKVEILDLSSLAPEKLEQTLLEVREEHSHKMLSVYEGQVIELVACKLPSNKLRLLLGLDLLVADVVSFKIILDDLTQLYYSPDSLGPLSWSLNQYLSQNHVLDTKYEKDKLFWQDKAKTIVPGSSLPLKNNPASLQSATYRRLQFSLNEAEYLSLKELTSEKKTTIAMLLLSLYAYVIGRYSGTQKLLINLPIFNRDYSITDTDQAVADFTDLVLVSADLRPFDSIYELVERIQTDFYACMSHDAFKGMEIEKLLSSQSDGIIAPIVFSCTEGIEQFSHKCTQLFGKPTFVITQTPQVYIDFQIFQNDKELCCIWDIPNDLFPDNMPEAMFTLLEKSIRQFLSKNGDLTKSDLENLIAKPLVTAPPSHAEPHHLLEGFYKTVKMAPSSIALIDGHNDQSFTYKELACYVTHMAGKLTEAGVCSGDKVALTVTRGIKEIVGILSILQIGACYVPITPNQPAARRENAINTMNISFVLVDSENLSKISPSNPFILFELEAAETYKEPSIESQSSAYVILTSGTTGVPKGVEIYHASAMNTILDINERLELSPKDRILNVSSIDFDLSVYDIFGTLTAGGQLIVVDQSHYRDAEEWLHLVDKYQVSVWNSVPLLFDMLLTVAEDSSKVLPLKAVLLSGDWVSSSLFTRLQKINSKTRFIGLGGATEASIWSNWYEVKSPQDFRGEFIPYGWALKNQIYRIVNRNLEDCPYQVPGELLIGGLGLAKCYCQDSKKTDEKFIVIDGKRWYRTGDQGVYDLDGCIRFLGRIDSQCKVRGHRIEVGEIERHLASYFHAKRAICWPCGPDGAFNHLEACVYQPGLEIDAVAMNAALDYLKTQLPSYMIPTVIYADDKVPLSANGKCDRKQLQNKYLSIEPSSALIQGGPPEDTLSLLVLKLWCQNLGIRSSEPDANYFFQGGDSLKAIKLASTINKEFQINLTTSELLEAQTLNELTNKIKQLTATKECLS